MTSSLTSRLLSGGAWSLTGRAGSILATILLTFVLARWLETSELGVYFLAISISVIMAALGQLGMDQAMVKLISSATAVDDTRHIPRFLLIGLSVSAAGAVLVAAILVSGLGGLLAEQGFQSASLRGVMGTVAVLSGLRILERFIAESFRGFHRIREAVLFRGLLSNWALVLVFAVLMALQPVGSLRVALTLTVWASALANLLGGLMLWRIASKFESGGAWPPLTNLFQLAAPLYFTSLALIVVNNADLWIVGLLLADTDVAVYGIALRLMLVVSVPLMIVNGVLPPMIGELSARGEFRELQDVLRGTATIAGIPAMAATGVLIFAGRTLIQYGFGAEYATIDAALVVTILATGQLVNVLVGSCAFALMMSGHQRSVMRITILGAIVTVAMALALGLKLGLIGVAAGAAAGLALQNLMMWASVRRRLGIWTHFSLAYIPRLVASGVRHVVSALRVERL